MCAYQVTWITNNLAVGHAPMSYDDLDAIKAQGIDGIVNLCEEFSDLHILEEGAGFEVFWLPVADEHAPEMSEMEEGLEWLDEATYLGKKILIHCKHGVGRTGTFITAYLLRRGFTMRKAEKLLRKMKSRASPTNFSQWWLLRKFGKKEGRLKAGEATADNRQEEDFTTFYLRYEAVLRQADALYAELTGHPLEIEQPSSDHSGGEQSKQSKTQRVHQEGGKVTRTLCSPSFTLMPIEAMYLNKRMNITLTSAERKEVIARCAARSGAVSQVAVHEEKVQRDTVENIICPLFQDEDTSQEHTPYCLLAPYKPFHCRIRELRLDTAAQKEAVQKMKEEIRQISQEIFHHIFAQRIKGTPPQVNRSTAISGKFIEQYFSYLAGQNPLPQDRE